MKIDWKKLVPDALIMLLFVLAAVIYCSPALDDKIIYAGDYINGYSAAHEGAEYRDQGGSTWWTGSMFSGMPNYQIGGGARYKSDTILMPFIRFFRWGTRNAIFILMFYLVAFYLLMRTFKIERWISLAGAFATSFSSYFFIIIAAQHHGKTVAITWMMLVLIGFVLIYRRQYLWGALLVMFFIPMGFFVHPQMSYYICMLIGVLFFAELYKAIRDSDWKHFGLATCTFALAFAVGMGIGSANIFANQEYAEQTMRGGHSDLVDAQQTDEAAAATAKGLDLEYATAWSEGIGETFTMMIPNLMGGMSGYALDEDSEFCKTLVQAGYTKSQAKEYGRHAPTYWGDKMFTSGPVYIGAIVCFLFLLGLLLVDGPYKWALLAATLFSILLSWGHNFMPLTKLFFNYFPMYNKFRAVESILIVAEITMPLLGFLALDAIRRQTLSPGRVRRAVYISAGVTGAICLVFALFGGSMFDFTSDYDNLPDWLLPALQEDRASMLQADAWRSLLFILLGAGLTWLYAEQKLKTQWFGLALTALILADMWPVNKRYFNNDNFEKRSKIERAAFAIEPYEQEILKDSGHFRVLNLADNTFNEARTSYRLKSIGGYSAAKLRRYQDLIDQHIAPEINPLFQSISTTNGNLAMQPGDSIYPVLNMLNMRYAVVPLQDGSKTPVLNPYAMGNAWYVDKLQVVENANAECDALRQIDLRTTAVLDRQFASYAEGRELMEHDSAASVTLTTYTPEYIEYDAVSANDGTIVFSEIYYPYGWKALIDGRPAEHFRVNYLLRALNVPAGEHHIRFEFRPESVERGNRLSVICIGIMLLTLIAAVVMQIKSTRKTEINE